MARKNSPLTGRNLGQTLTAGGRPSALTGWVERDRERQLNKNFKRTPSIQPQLLHYESSQYTGLKLSTDAPFKRTTSIQPQTMMLHYESSQYTGLKLSTDAPFKRTTTIQPQ